jgi:hypothetical protein
MSSGKKRSGSSRLSSDSEDSAQVHVSPRKKNTMKSPPPRPTTTPSTGSNIPSGSGIQNLGTVVPVAKDPDSSLAVRRPVLGQVTFAFYFKNFPHVPS